MALTTRWPPPNLAADWRTRYRIKPHNVRRAWDEYLGRFPWEWFCTLTFDPTRANCTRDTADREAFAWCNLAARTLRKPIGWVYAPERSRGGAWHAHALLAGGVEERDLNRLKGIWQIRNGIADIKPVFNRRGVSFYTSKSAAMNGTLVCADTLPRYRAALHNAVVVALHPPDADRASHSPHGSPVSG